MAARLFPGLIDLEEESKTPAPPVVVAYVVNTPMTISTMKAATIYIQLRFLGVSSVSAKFDIFSSSLVGSCAFSGRARDLARIGIRCAEPERGRGAHGVGIGYDATNVPGSCLAPSVPGAADERLPKPTMEAEISFGFSRVFKY